MELITKRRGVIKLSYDILNFPYYNDKSHKVFCKLFSMFIPLHIVNNGFYGFIEYYGYCEFFDLVSENELAPEYRVISTEEENGEISISFNRII